MDHLSSVLPNIYLSFINDEGDVLYSSNNTSGKVQLNLRNLAAGRYYIVSEGIGENGIISTQVEVRVANGYITTTKRQPYVISFIPTAGSSDIQSLGMDSVRQEIQYYDHFGNPNVKVQHGFSPLGNDIFTLQAYDSLNRETNQWQSVSDNATNSVYGNGMEFKDIECEYDKNGNITKDLNKKIAYIPYNILNLPSQLTFGRS